MGKLTALKAQNETKPGRYTDGDGLHLHIRPTGRKVWVLRYMKRGKTRDMGLGAFPAVTLARARVKASEARKLVEEGVDPILDRRIKDGEAVQPDRTFKAAAEKLIESHKAGWRNAKHATQWTATLKTYAYPVIGERHVKDVDTAAVLEVLKPIWNTKTETATRVRGRIEAVLDAAKALHWRSGENPARWKGNLASLLPRPTKVRAVEHHPSVPWARVPAFLAVVRGKAGASALALEFAILTAARSGEARGVTLGEIDLDAAVWTIPKDRMKSHREHRVPLSTAAIALLHRADIKDREPGQLLFPGQANKQPLSDMALTVFMRKLNAVKKGESIPWADSTTGAPAVPHGFRSSFRVWAGETTATPRDVVEAALAHVVENETERAYQRSDLLERRRALMEEWGAWCATATPP